MAGKRNHPLKLDNGNWNREETMAYILHRMETTNKPLSHVLSEGYMADVGEHRGLPTVSAIWLWAEESPELAAKLARVKTERAAALAEEVLDLADKSPKLNHQGNIDGGDVKNRELQVRVRQWLAEKLDPDTYGSQANLKVETHMHIDMQDIIRQAQGRVIEGATVPTAAALPPLDDGEDLLQ